MTALSAALADLDRARAIRQAAENRIGAQWRDLVFRRMQSKDFAPLADEEARYLAALRQLDCELDRCLASIHD